MLCRAELQSQPQSPPEPGQAAARVQRAAPKPLAVALDQESALRRPRLLQGSGSWEPEGVPPPRLLPQVPLFTLQPLNSAQLV